MNNIELSPRILAELFSESLVLADQVGVFSPADKKTEEIAPPPEIRKETPSPEPASPRAWKILGDNKKNILIVVSYPDAVYLPDDELNFLTNMLSACKLSLADVAIINLHNHTGFAYKDLLTHLKSNKVFLFGIEPVDFGLPVSFPAFQVQSFSGATYLFAPSLGENRQDKLLKSKLWLCLQRIFGI